jgi:hypothetical protein
MATKSINTKRLELYRKYVDDAEGEYPFDSRYELFSLAAVIGYLDGTPYNPTSDEAGYSQDFIKVDDIQRKNHRATINFIYNLTALELAEYNGVDINEDMDELEQEAWTRTKEYADQGLTILDDELSVQGEIDLVRLLNDAEEDWLGRTRHIEEIFSE